MCSLLFRHNNDRPNVRCNVVHFGADLQEVRVVLHRELRHVADEEAVQQRAAHDDDDQVHALHRVLRVDVAVTHGRERNDGKVESSAVPGT